MHGKEVILPKSYVEQLMQRLQPPGFAERLEQLTATSAAPGLDRAQALRRRIGELCATEGETVCIPVDELVRELTALVADVFSQIAGQTPGTTR